MMQIIAGVTVSLHKVSYLAQGHLDIPSASAQTDNVLIRPPEPRPFSGCACALINMLGQAHT